jgi:RNA polymerase sigma-70 factor (ECF subfamily)
VTQDLLEPHLDAAYNLARWLTGNPADAQDIVQEACLRAIAAADRFRGGNTRAWLLTIVRNTCYSNFRARRGQTATAFEEDTHTPEARHATPEDIALGDELARDVHGAIAALTSEFREVVVLRELEGLSYKEIADVAGVPIGTVMSRLSRARAQLQQTLARHRRSQS